MYSAMAGPLLLCVRIISWFVNNSSSESQTSTPGAEDVPFPLFIIGKVSDERGVGH